MLQSFEVDFFCLQGSPPEVLLDIFVEGLHQCVRAPANKTPRNLSGFKDSAPLVVPVNKEGNESTIGTEGQPLRVTGVGAPGNRDQFGVPGYVRSLVFEFTRACDGVETQGIFLYKHPIFKSLFMDLDDRLHFVCLRCEEEGLQIVKGVDGRIRWSGVDGSEDELPRFRGILDIDAW